MMAMGGLGMMLKSMGINPEQIQAQIEAVAGAAVELRTEVAALRVEATKANERAARMELMLQNALAQRTAH